METESVLAASDFVLQVGKHGRNVATEPASTNEGSQNTIKRGEEIRSLQKSEKSIFSKQLQLASRAKININIFNYQLTRTV